MFKNEFFVIVFHSLSLILLLLKFLISEFYSQINLSGIDPYFNLESFWFVISTNKMLFFTFMINLNLMFSV